jgi:hypothetical protein
VLASGREAEVYANGMDEARLGHTDDPLHLNDIKVLREEMASAFPTFAAGDVMISMRNLNAIAVLDQETL